MKSHIKPELKPLTQVSGEIKDLLTSQKAAEKASQEGRELVKALKENKSIETELKSLGVSFVEESKVTRDSDKVNTPINNIAFMLRKPESNKRRVVGHYLPELKAYVVVWLKGVTPGKVSTLDADTRANLLKQLEASFGLRDYDYYLKSLMKNTKVSIKS